MNQKEVVVRFENVYFSYNGSLALEDINLDIHKGDFMGVIGPNGSGKTTLLKLVLGFLKPESGTVSVFGKPANKQQSIVGYVPQHTSFDATFPATVLDVVLMGRLGQSTGFFRYSTEDKEIAEGALKQVGINKLKKKHISELSGGQKQRVLIARALASSARLLILDEPTASVDSRKEEDIYHLLKELNATTTIILVTHDLGFISSYVNRVACVNQRLACHPTSEITGEMINEAYQRNVEMIRHKCGL